MSDETPWTKLRPDEFLSTPDESELGRWGIGQGPEAPDRRILREIVDIIQPSSFLEVGCGSGIEIQGLQMDGLLDGLGYRGYDFTHRFIAYCKARYPAQTFDVVDATQMDELETAEIVYSRHMLEHIEDGETAFHNLCRAAKDYVVISWFIRPSWEDEKIEQVGEFIHHTYSIRTMIRIARQYGILYRYDFDHHSTKASVWVIAKSTDTDVEDPLPYTIPYFMQREMFLTSCLRVPPDPQEELNAALDVIHEMVGSYEGVIITAERVPELLDVLVSTMGALVETYSVDPEIEKKVKNELRTVAARAEAQIGSIDPEAVWALIQQARDAQARGQSATR